MVFVADENSYLATRSRASSPDIMYSNPVINGHVSLPTSDADTILYDVSNRMARAQLARQISNGSSTFKQRAARIFKPNSAGNSPQNIQRRRTSASHKPTRHRSEFLCNNVPVMRQGVLQPQEQLRQVPPTRPMSWHPSSVATHRGSTCSSNYYAPSRQSMTVNRHSLSISQHGQDQNSPMDQCSSIDGSMFSYPSSAMGLYENNPVGYDLDSSYRSCVGFDSSGQAPYPNIPVAFGNSNYSSMDYSTQTWAESLSTFPSYTNPPTPEFLPIQLPSDLWQGLTGNSTTNLPKKQSKELVGMGLYDNPTCENLDLETTISQSFGDSLLHSQQESTGKGLKLEETWQPPEKDDASEADDDDEDEEEDEDESPSNDATYGVQEGPEAVTHLTYGNLSDKSFFFDNDETYYDNIVVNQGIPGVAPSMQGAALQLSTWV